MFGSIGWQEILVILVLALLVFGPRRLPELGHTLGKALSEFRRATSDLKRTLNAELALDDDERTRTPRRPDLAPPQPPMHPQVRPRVTEPPPGTAPIGAPPAATTPRGVAKPEPDETEAEPAATEAEPAATH